MRPTEKRLEAIQALIDGEIVKANRALMDVEGLLIRMGMLAQSDPAGIPECAQELRFALAPVKEALSMISRTPIQVGGAAIVEEFTAEIEGRLFGRGRAPVAELIAKRAGFEPRTCPDCHGEPRAEPCPKCGGGRLWGRPGRLAKDDVLFSDEELIRRFGESD